MASGVLPGPTYQVARGLFGQGALSELVLYGKVSMTLDAFDVPNE